MKDSWIKKWCKETIFLEREVGLREAKACPPSVPMILRSNCQSWSITAALEVLNLVRIGARIRPIQSVKVKIILVGFYDTSLRRLSDKWRRSGAWCLSVGRWLNRLFGGHMWNICDQTWQKILIVSRESSLTTGEDVGGGWNLGIESLVSSGSSISSTIMPESPLIGCEICQWINLGVPFKYWYLQSLAHPVVQHQHLIKFSSLKFSGVPAAYDKDWLSVLWLICKKFDAVWGHDHCLMLFCSLCRLPWVEEEENELHINVDHASDTGERLRNCKHD